MNLPDLQTFSQEIINKNLSYLSKAITYAESKKETHQQFAQKLIHQLLPHTGKAKRIAITGVPGAGKSTFIESLGMFLITQGKKVAVLAIDPSSTISGGSILGDKTRMEQLSKSEKAYIRPSATGGSLGGITARTYETLLLCEAAGFDVILVETVGVGQSETLVHDMTDFFTFINVSGTGDDLQGIKRGIMEMTDLIFLNKTDLIERKIINDAKVNLNRSLHFLPNKKSGWKRKVMQGSAYKNQGVAEVWEQIELFYEQVPKEYLENLRLKQKEIRAKEYLKEMIWNHVEKSESVQTQLAEGLKDLTKNTKSPYELAQKIVHDFLSNKKQ